MGEERKLMSPVGERGRSAKVLKPVTRTKVSFLAFMKLKIENWESFLFSSRPWLGFFSALHNSHALPLLSGHWFATVLALAPSCPVFGIPLCLFFRVLVLQCPIFAGANRLTIPEPILWAMCDTVLYSLY